MSESHKPHQPSIAKQQLAQTFSPDTSPLSDKQGLSYEQHLQAALRIVNDAFAQVAEQRAIADQSRMKDLSIEQLSPLLSDVFFNAVKNVQRFETGSEHFLRIKQQYRTIKGLRVSEFNKAVKLPQSARVAAQQTMSSDTPLSPANGQPSSQPPATDDLVEFIKTYAVLFSDPSKRLYGSFRVTHPPVTDSPHAAVNTAYNQHEHWETYAMTSTDFRLMVGKLFYDHQKRLMSSHALNEVCDQLASIARYEGQCFTVFRRVAYDEATETIYIDSGNKQWDVIAINAQGWQVLANEHCQTIKFIRTDETRALATPKQGGSINQLWQHLNIRHPHDRYLILAWLLECLRLQTPYPVLEISGEQGSSKSTLQDRLRSLIDPNEVNLRGKPQQVETIYNSASNDYLLSFNNLSGLSTDIQDALCNVSTGGGDAVRKKYTDGASFVTKVKNPVIMNGILELATRPDLGDRVIAIQPDPLSDEQRQSDIVLQQRWQQDRGVILGALYELMVKVLQALPQVEKTQKLRARLADYTLLGQALFQAMGVKESFYYVYKANRDRVVERAIDFEPIIQALITFMAHTPLFEGRKSDLLTCLKKDYLPLHYDASKLPKSPQGFGAILKRLTSALIVKGIRVEELGRKSDGIHIRVTKQDALSSESPSAMS